MKTEYNKTLLQTAWILGASFLTLLTILHFVEPEFDPTWRLISEYEIGEYGWLMRLAFFCWGGGFLSLTISLWFSLDTLSGKIGKWWLLMISMALFGAGIFITQPMTDMVRGTEDIIHSICGMTMIFTFPIVATILAYNLSKHFTRKSEREKLVLVTLLVWLGFMTFLGSMIIYIEQVESRAYGDSVLIGIPNRFMVLLYTAWLITVARLLITENKVDNSSTVNPSLEINNDEHMMFWKSENKLESKDRFRSKIEKYYFELAGNQIPVDLVKELVDKITDTQYEDYKRFWKQYPKSRRRYSMLKLEDLENPFNHYEITGFFKRKDLNNYRNFSKVILRMTDEEFNDFEVKKYQYETK